MVKTQTDTEMTIDDRIKRLSRKFLCDMAPDRGRMSNLRDRFWGMSDYFAECGNQIDRELRRRRRANPKWKRDRPKPSEIREYEAQLKSLIGHDVQKLELVEKLLEILPLFAFDPLKAQTLLELASDSNGKELQRVVRVLTREKGGRGRKYQDVMPIAYEMTLAGRKIDEIARELWNDAYKQDRSGTRNRMKAALHRYKKRLAQNLPNGKDGDKTPRVL